MANRTINFLGFEVNTSPKEWGRSWGLALANTGRGFVELFSNKRLWIGIAVSLALHGLIFLLSSDILKGRKVSDDAGDLLDVGVYDESLPPKAAKMLQEEQNPFSQPSAATQEGAPIDLSKADVRMSAKVDMADFNLDQSAADFSGDMININPNATLSTEDILSQSPIDINRSVGGLGSENPFARVSQMGGSPIELDQQATTIGSDASRPDFGSDDGSSAAAAQAAETAGSQQSGFTLTGDLGRGDIVSWAMPEYPGWARQRGLSNITVSVRFTADRDGNVLPTMVVTNSTGYPDWDSQVRQTLSRWKFRPSEGGIARRNATITFVFVLT